MNKKGTASKPFRTNTKHLTQLHVNNLQKCSTTVITQHDIKGTLFFLMKIIINNVYLKLKMIKFYIIIKIIVLPQS